MDWQREAGGDGRRSSSLTRRSPSIGRRAPSEPRRPGGGGPRRDGLPGAAPPFAMKLLTPQVLAAAIIGRGGAVVAEMRQSCQCRIVLSEAVELFPRTEQRVLTARADSEDSLNDVAQQVVEILTELAAREPSEAVSHEGRLKLGAVVPRAALGGLLGAGGAAIRQLCEASGAMIKVRDAGLGSGPDASQEVSLKGTAQALEHVLREVNRHVQAVSSEPWFSGWAASAVGVPRSLPAQPRASLSSGPPGPGSDYGAREDADARSSYDALELEREAADRAGAEAGPCTMKLLLPHALAAAVAGRNGAELAELRQVSRARVSISDSSETFPRTDYRVLTARAESEEGLNAVARAVVDRLADVAEREPSDHVVYEGSLKITALLPRAAVGGIIGTGGATIRALCDNSGAYVKVREPVGGTGPDATQKVEIKGSVQALEYVLREVNHHVQQANGDPWFPAWSSSPTGLLRGGGGFGDRGGGRGPPNSGPAPAPAPRSLAITAGMDLINRVVEGMPTYVMEESRGFAMTCVVPNRLVGPVVGRGGGGIQDVQTLTKTRIALREIPGDPDNRSMNIAGPLLNTCAAYMLMMKRYLDAEKDVNAR